MTRCLVAVLVFAAALPLAGQGVDLIVDVEGVRRSEKVEFRPNEVRYEPRFDSGGGAGVGLNWYFSDRVSLEVKAAGLASRMMVRRTGSDFVTVADLGYAQLYPITAILQWHLTGGGSFRPYVGAGAAHVILRNIERSEGGVNGVAFEDPTGLVVNAGVIVPMSKRFSLYADGRYIPVESQATARFGGAPAPVEIDVRPLIVSFGIGYRF